MPPNQNSKNTTVSLTRPRAVLFDWDGTIVDSAQSVLVAQNHVRRTFGLPDFDLQTLIENVRAGTAREIFKTLYPDRAQEALDLYYGHIELHRFDTLKIVDHIVEFLDLLKYQNIPMGVVSNMGHKPLVNEIDRIGFTKYFPVVVGAGEAARGKPSPDPIYLTLERMGMLRGEARDAWFIGDMETDEKSAKAAGCPFLYYTGGISDSIERDQMRAALKFDSYADVIEVFNKLLT